MYVSKSSTGGEAVRVESVGVATLWVIGLFHDGTVFFIIPPLVATVSMVTFLTWGAKNDVRTSLEV